MKIMHVMAGAKEGGAENIMLESVLALAESGLSQAVITRPDNHFRHEQFEKAGIKVYLTDFNRLWPLLTYQTIKRAIHDFTPDVIEYWMGRAGQFAPAAYADRSIGWYGGYYKRKRFKNCLWHVGLTKDLLRHIRDQGVAETHSHIIHTYADFEAAEPASRTALNTPADVPVALALARLHWKKGLDTLLEATAKTPGLYVWIAGDGPLEDELKAMANRLGIENRVRFLGWRNDRGALLAACDFVAFPSRYEPFGTVTVDAWAANKPLIAADAVGPAAYVEDGKNGLLIPKDDVGALTNALQRLMGDPELCKKLVKGGQAAYQGQFTKKVFVADSIALYKKIRG